MDPGPGLHSGRAPGIGTVLAEETDGHQRAEPRGLVSPRGSGDDCDRSTQRASSVKVPMPKAVMPVKSIRPFGWNTHASGASSAGGW